MFDHVISAWSATRLLETTWANRQWTWTWARDSMTPMEVSCAMHHICTTSHAYGDTSSIHIIVVASSTWLYVFSSLACHPGLGCLTSMFPIPQFKAGWVVSQGANENEFGIWSQNPTSTPPCLYGSGWAPSRCMVPMLKHIWQKVLKEDLQCQLWQSDDEWEINRWQQFKPLFWGQTIITNFAATQLALKPPSQSPSQSPKS